MPEADKEFRIRFVSDTDQAIQRAQMVREAISQIKEDLRKMGEQARESYDILSKSMVKAFEQQKIASATTPYGIDHKKMEIAMRDIEIYKEAMTRALKEIKQQDKGYSDAAVTNIKTVNKARKEEQEQIKSTKSSFLDHVKTIAASLGIYNLLATAINSFVNALKEAVANAYEFSKAFFSMGVAINVLQRSGIKITIDDVSESIDRLREKFQIFSEKELVVGSAQLLNLIRDFGLTKEQIFKLQEAIATLAVVNGRAMDDVQRTVALALSSGYTEGLQRLGVSINRVTIAMEAARLGYSKNYMSLTEQQRAQATYNLILEKTKKYEEDLLQYYQTAPGKIDKTKASMKDLSTTIGEVLLPSIANLMEKLGQLTDKINYTIKAHYNLIDSEKQLGEENKNQIAFLDALLQAWDNFINGLKLANSAIKSLTAIDLSNIFARAGEGYKALVNFQSLAIASAKTLYEFFSALGNGKLWNPNAFKERLANNLNEIMGITSDFVEDEKKEFMNRWREAKGIEEKRRNDLENIASELGQNILEIQEDWLQKRNEAQQWYDDRLVEIEGQYQQKLEDIERQKQEKIADIERQYLQKREDAYRSYHDGLIDINIWYQQAIEDANAKYREQQLEAEEDYQEKLLRLREEFLFDLEDAIRERDARQVLNLIRRYNLDRQQAEREHQNTLEDLKQQHQRELEEIRRQRQRKLRELRIELQRRLAEINLWRQREYEDIQIWLKREYEEAALWKAREEEEALERYNRMLKEADDYYTKMVSKAINNAIAQYNITAKEMRALYDLLSAYIGNNGYMTKLWQNYQSWLNGLSLVPQTLNLPPMQQINQMPSVGAQAIGGTYFANKPTAAIFGEAGPEYAMFIPANKMKNSSIGEPIKLQVWLSPDLEARVVNRAMDEFSEVAIEIYKENMR